MWKYLIYDHLFHAEQINVVYGWQICIYAFSCLNMFKRTLIIDCYKICVIFIFHDSTEVHNYTLMPLQPVSEK